METNIKDGGLEDAPPPLSINLSLTEYALEICVCLEVNQLVEFSCWHLNLLLKTGKTAKSELFFSELAEIWLKDEWTRRKWRTRNIEKSKYLHLHIYITF